MKGLFIYGTLGPEGPNNHIMQEIGGSWIKATVQGSLHKAGWAADMGYLGMTLEPKTEVIEGHIFIPHTLEHFSFNQPQ